VASQCCFPLWEYRKSKRMQNRAEMHHELGLPPPEYKSLVEEWYKSIFEEWLRPKDFVKGRPDVPKQWLRPLSKASQLPPHVAASILSDSGAYVWFGSRGCTTWDLKTVFGSPDKSGQELCTDVQEYLFSKYRIFIRPRDREISLDILFVRSVPDFLLFLEDLWTLLADKMGEAPKDAYFRVANRCALIQWLPTLKDWHPDAHGAVFELSSGSTSNNSHTMSAALLVALGTESFRRG